MWSLHRSGEATQFHNGIVVAGEIDGFGGKELFDDGQSLCKAGDTCASLIKRHTKLLVLVRPVACSQPKFDATIGELIQRRDLSGEQGRMAIIIDTYVAADTQRRGGGGSHSERGNRC